MDYRDGRCGMRGQSLGFHFSGQLSLPGPAWLACEKRSQSRLPQYARFQRLWPDRSRYFTPRPNYWAALLWRKLMGTTVLDAGRLWPGLKLYAHCLPGHSGGVTLLAINNSKTRTQLLELPLASDRYTLAAHQLDGIDVQLNGEILELQADDKLPGLRASTSLQDTLNFLPQASRSWLSRRPGIPTVTWLNSIKHSAAARATLLRDKAHRGRTAIP